MLGYFNYIYSLCRSHSINNVCQIYRTKEELLSAEQKELKRLTRDGDLELIITSINNIEEEIEDVAVPLSKDANVVYKRCKTRLRDLKHSIKANGKIDYETMFDVMIDYCWLLASIQSSLEKEYDNIQLLSYLDSVDVFITRYLAEKYQDAQEDKKEISYIKEARRERKHILPTYPTNSNVRKYMSRSFRHSDLDREEHFYRTSSTEKLLIFYGMTITSIKVAELRREML